MERHKVRLVAKGFTQSEGIEYRKTFSLVSQKDLFKILMALVLVDLHFSHVLPLDDETGHFLVKN